MKQGMLGAQAVDLLTPLEARLVAVFGDKPRTMAQFHGPDGSPDDDSDPVVTPAEIASAPGQIGPGQTPIGRPIADVLAEIDERTSGAGPLAGDGALLRRCAEEIRRLTREQDHHSRRADILRAERDAAERKAFGSRSVPVSAAADRLASGYVQRLRDGTWEWSPDGGFDQGVVKLSPAASSWLSKVVKDASRPTLTEEQLRATVKSTIEAKCAQGMADMRVCIAEHELTCAIVAALLQRMGERPGLTEKALLRALATFEQRAEERARAAGEHDLDGRDLDRSS